MYALQDKEGHWPSEYFRTREEAVEAMSHRSSTSAEGTKKGEEYLEIVEVERASQPCKTCGGESENKPEQYLKFPFCRSCYYTGAAEEFLRQYQIVYFARRLGEETGISPDIHIEHTGGGCFWLAFYFDGLPDHFYMATDGEAALPDFSDEWGFVGTGPRSGEWDGEEGEQLFWMGEQDEPITDEDVIGLIAEHVLKSLNN